MTLVRLPPIARPRPVGTGGLVLMWGTGNVGTRGDGTQGPPGNAQVFPTFVRGLIDVVQAVSGSFGEVFAVKKDGSLWDCGVGAEGSLGLQLGGLTAPFVTRPQQVLALSKGHILPLTDAERVRLFATTGNSSIAVMKNGDCWGMGNNGYGVFCLGWHAGGWGKYVPVRMEASAGVPLNGSNITLLEAGRAQFWAVKLEGGITKMFQLGQTATDYAEEDLEWQKTWPGGGQIGAGEQQIVEMKVTGLVQIARLKDGTVRVKGTNRYGARGNGNITGRLIQYQQDKVSVGAATAGTITLKFTWNGVAYTTPATIEPIKGKPEPAIKFNATAAEVEEAVQLAEGPAKQKLPAKCVKVIYTTKTETLAAGVTLKFQNEVEGPITGQTITATGLTGGTPSYTQALEGALATHELAEINPATGKRWLIGQLDARATAVPMPGGQKALAVAINEKNCYAILEDGTVVAWGSNINGNCGLGFAANDEQSGPNGVTEVIAANCTLTPTVVPGLLHAKLICAGGPTAADEQAWRSHVLVVCEATIGKPEVFGWGGNGECVLGNANMPSQASPVRVAAMRPDEAMIGSISGIHSQMGGTVAVVAGGKLGPDPLTVVQVPGSRAFKVKWRIPPGSRTKQILIQVRRVESEPSWPLGTAGHSGLPQPPILADVTARSSTVVFRSFPEPQGAMQMYVGMEIESPAFAAVPWVSGTAYVKGQRATQVIAGKTKTYEAQVAETVPANEPATHPAEWREVSLKEVKEAGTTVAITAITKAGEYVVNRPGNTTAINQSVVVGATGGGAQPWFVLAAARPYEGLPEEEYEVTEAVVNEILGAPGHGGALPGSGIYPNAHNLLEVLIGSKGTAPIKLTSKAAQVTITYPNPTTARLEWPGSGEPSFYVSWGKAGSKPLTKELPGEIAVVPGPGELCRVDVPISSGETIDAEVEGTYTDPWNGGIYPKTTGRTVELVPNTLGEEVPWPVRTAVLAPASRPLWHTGTKTGDAITIAQPSQWLQGTGTGPITIAKRVWYTHGPGEGSPLTQVGEGASYTVTAADVGLSVRCGEWAQNAKGIGLAFSLSESTQPVTAV